MNVAATQVQRPGNIVEGSHQHAVGVLLTQRLADTHQLFTGRLAGILQGMNADRMLRDRRTPMPYPLQRVEVST